MWRRVVDSMNRLQDKIMCMVNINCYMEEIVIRRGTQNLEDKREKRIDKR